MPHAKEIAGAAAEVLLEKHASGITAVYIVEVRNRQEIREVKELFSSLAPEFEVYQLAEGTITAYAVHVADEEVAVLEEIELALKENYRFSISERSSRKTIYDVVHDLCESSDSILRPVPTCGICLMPEPFPTTVTFVDAHGQRLAEGCYCAACIESMGSVSDRELTTRLLAADRTGLAPLGRLRLSEEPRRQGSASGFRSYGEENPRIALAS
ncbi:MAG TPA: hypothetical protein PLU39_18600 [Armatimonadota bacterium]|nr:hypothetical protein [Armatimonadota bacterium]HPO74467.1 hypothetical protein [Armatimonadota bacterium]HPT99878.1 hypothetical protein [Armatimonadota bacterium]